MQRVNTVQFNLLIQSNRKKKKMIRKHSTVKLLLIIALLMAGCTAPSATPVAESPASATEAPTAAPAEPTAAPAEATSAPTAAEAIKVAVVFASSGLGDKSFNDSLYAGVDQASKELNITWKYAEPNSDSEYEVYLRQFAQSGDYKLIISNGYSQGSSLEKVAPEFPDQNFMIVDTEVDQPNVASYGYKSEEAAYLAGIVAGLATKDTSIPNINDQNVIGFVGGMDIPLIQAFAAGFKGGALSVNPDVTVLISYVGSWADPAKAKELALSQFQQGADIVYQVASQGGLGVIEGAKQSGYLAIGQDDNQNALAPDNMLLSVLKRIDNTGALALKETVDGTWQPGVHNLGLAEGGVDITNEDSNVKIPDSIMAEVEKARQSIISGELTVPTTLQ